jgi:hypothetical protein
MLSRFIIFVPCQSLWEIVGKNKRALLSSSILPVIPYVLQSYNGQGFLRSYSGMDAWFFSHLESPPKFT